MYKNSSPGPSLQPAHLASNYSCVLGSTMAPLWVLMISVLGVLILIMLAMMTLLGFARCLGKCTHVSWS